MKASCLFASSLKQFQRTHSSVCIFSHWCIDTPFSWIYQAGFVLHLSDEDMVLWIPGVRVSSCAAFQWCTDRTDCFLPPIFCIVCRVILTDIWLFIFFYHSVLIMFMIEIADKFRHRWLMTVMDTYFQKPPLEIKSFIWWKNINFMRWMIEIFLYGTLVQWCKYID